VCRCHTGSLHGSKSHDCHIFMENLIPTAFSSLLKHLLNPLTEISQFFKSLCASNFRLDELEKIEKIITIIICQLEQFFPQVSLTLWNIFMCILHMNLYLADLFNIGGCTLLKDSWVTQNEQLKIGPERKDQLLLFKLNIFLLAPLPISLNSSNNFVLNFGMGNLWHFTMNLVKVHQLVQYMNILQLGLNKKCTMPSQLKKSLFYDVYLRVLYNVLVNIIPTS